MVVWRTNRRTKTRFPVGDSGLSESLEEYRDISEPHVEAKTPSGYTTLHVEIVGARDKISEEELQRLVSEIAQTVEHTQEYLLQPPDADSRAWVRNEIGEDSLEEVHYLNPNGVPPRNLHILLILTDNARDVGAGNTGAKGERGSFKVFAGVPGSESSSFDLVGNLTTVAHETGHTLGPDARGKYEFNQFGAFVATRTLLEDNHLDVPGFRLFFNNQLTRATSPSFRANTRNQAKRFVRHFYRLYPEQVRALASSDYDRQLLEIFLAEESA